MNLTLIVALVTTVISGSLAVSVLHRFRTRGGAHLLLWGIGLALYFVAGAAEMILSFGWSDVAFRTWYWSGALVIPPVLGQGTLHLLVRKKTLVAALDIALAVVVFASLVWAWSISLDASRFTPAGDVTRFLTEAYRDVLPQSPVRRILSPVMNGYGTLLLAGGAVYSSYLFLRKQIMPNRVLGNVFIALGGVLPAFAGSLLRLSDTVPELVSVASTSKYLAILFSAILLFIGFRLAVSGAPAPSPQRAAQVA